MSGFGKEWKRAAAALLLFGSLAVFCGCASIGSHEGDLPPVLKQDELLRPYDKVAVLEVKRERYGSPADLSPEDYSWAYDALREQAGRMGADAVILPEVKVELERYILFPTSVITAKGIAIKFK